VNERVHIDNFFFIKHTHTHIYIDIDIMMMGIQIGRQRFVYIFHVAEHAPKFKTTITTLCELDSRKVNKKVFEVLISPIS